MSSVGEQALAAATRQWRRDLAAREQHEVAARTMELIMNKS